MLFVAIAANICANIAFKHFVHNTEIRASWPSVGLALLQPSFWIGCFLGVTLLGCYLYSIRTIPLSMAYTVATSLSIAGITCAGVFVYGEVLGVRTLIGIVVVLIGVVLITSG